MTTLFVAAGGGGDAVGILLARRVLEPHCEGPALISTCAWERLRVDPMPGPRPISSFTGLGQIGGQTVEVLPSSDTVPPRRSMLPRLAAEADARVFLHDFEGGAKGLAKQLSKLAASLGADRVVVVDVGGDVVARGDEAGLLSPLADSMTLAGVLATTLPTNLAVVGPGADAELSEQQVIDRLSSLDAELAGRISDEDVQRCGSVLEWHPTEASALVAASAVGARGAVEMRRGRQPTPLTERSCEVWTCENVRIQDFPLTHAIADTQRLKEAIRVMERVGVNEIAYEQRKLKDLAANEPFQSPGRPIAELARDARSHGATHITTRRLLERAGTPGTDEAVLQELESTGVRVGGLWELASLSRLA